MGAAGALDSPWRRHYLLFSCDAATRRVRHGGGDAHRTPSNRPSMPGEQGKLMPFLLVALIVVPLVEIALFIQVGGLIGLVPTLAVIVATALAGTFLVRSQGLRVLGQVRGSFERLSDP